MEYPTENVNPTMISPKLGFVGIASVVLFAVGLSRLSMTSQDEDDGEENPGPLKSILLFCYSCFFKPHSSYNGDQRDALENFYSGQARVYDSTRKVLLQGREDILALAAAALRFRAEKDGRSAPKRRIWVDVRFVSLLCTSLED
jgi:betaine lipid synthase